MQTTRRAQQFGSTPARPFIQHDRGRGARGRGTSSQPVNNHAQGGDGQTPRGGFNNASNRATGRGASVSRGATRARGAGRGFVSKSFNDRRSSPSIRQPVLPTDPPPDQIKPNDYEKLRERRTQLHARYEQLRQDAMRQGLMPDEQQRSLDSRVKVVAKCTQMCDEKERVDRMFEFALDSTEMLPCPENGQMVPIEGRMVKRFRRSAAGTSVQQPQELRTPHTLSKTLDYLINRIIGGSQHLGRHHKFVWDRTRAIRNDFSIQSLDNPQLIRYEIDCYERIARFHLLSMHQMSDRGNAEQYEGYSAKQEGEQMAKTFQTLFDKYDAFRHLLDFPNEAEFRAYYILLLPTILVFDYEERMQKWPHDILSDGRVQIAVRLYEAAGKLGESFGGKEDDPIPAPIFQGDTGLFWSLLGSRKVGYLMACAAEVGFPLVRFYALDALWRTAKNASRSAQPNLKTWTKDALTKYLGFDDEQQTEDFCSAFDTAFSSDLSGRQYLDFSSNAEKSLDKSSLSTDQVFSEKFVESKRHGRTLAAVMNGMSIAEAVRAGLATEVPTHVDGQVASNTDRSNMFYGDDDEEDEIQISPEQQSSTPTLNPAASVFNPGTLAGGTQQPVAAAQQPKWMTNFGQEHSPDSAAPGGPRKGIFGQMNVQQQAPVATSSATPLQSIFTQPQSAPTQPAFQPTPPDTGPAAGSSGFTPFGFASLSTQTPPSVTPNPLQTPQSQPKPAEQTSRQASSSTGINFAIQKPAETQGPKSFFNLTPSTTDKVEPAKAPASALDPAQSPLNAPPKITFSFPSTTTSTSASFLQPATSEPSQQTANLTFDPAASALSTATTRKQPSFTFPTSASANNTDPKADSNSAPDRNSSVTESSRQPPITERRSTSEFQFAAISNATDLTSTTPVGSPAQSTNTSSIPVKPSQPFQPFVPLDQPKASHVVPTQSPAQVVKQASQPEPQIQPKPTKEELAKHLCRIGLAQQGGIIDMFISYKVASIVKDVIQGWQDKKLQSHTDALKTNYLSRKYLPLWKSKVEQRQLEKRAKKRREMLVIRMQQEKGKELERKKAWQEIEESRKIKEQIQQKNEQGEEYRQKRQEQEKQIAHDVQAMRPPPTNPAQTAGQKRKTLANSTSQCNIPSTSMSPMHKRSRTVGGSSEDSIAFRFSSSPSRSTYSNPLAGTSLRRTLSQKSLRQSISQQRLDQTQTDYFRLKAAGIDPTTPFIPDTAATLAARKRREAEQREAASERITRRTLSRRSVRSSESSVSSSSPPPQSIPSEQPTSQPRPQATISASDEDTFLKQLREAREAMGQDVDWFKTQSAELEKEIEQQEDLRRSKGSNTSAPGSFTMSTGGFAMSLNGDKYVPPQLKPGQTLSRTEERIRQFGARGLGKVPIGGSPGSDYRAVPMSKRSASALRLAESVASSVNGGSRRKRSIDEVEAPHSLELANEVQHATSTVQQLAKKARSRESIPGRGITIQDLNNLRNPFTNHDNHPTPDDDEGYSDEGEEEFEEQEPVVQHKGMNGQPFGQYDDYDEEDEDAEDEDDEEEKEEEEEEEEEVDQLALAAQQYHAQACGFQGEEEYLYDEDEEEAEEEEQEDEEEEEEEDDNGSGLSVPPQTSRHASQGSRAMSASVATPETNIGSTLDDAIELSD